MKIKTRYHGYSGTKHNQATRSNSDSGVYWMIADASLSDDALLILWSDAGGDLDSYRCSHEHDCCACYFSGEPWIMRRGRRAIIRQSWGINI